MTLIIMMCRYGNIVS